MLEISTLGNLSIRMGGEEISTIGSRKAEGILVYLAMEGGRHNRNSLSALFWPESPESKAQVSLRVALSSLRKHVGEYLEIDRRSSRIRKGAKVYLDVFDFETKLAKRQVEQALDVYHGDFLQGFFLEGTMAFEDWRLWEQERLRKELISALQNAIMKENEVGNYQRSQALAQELLKLDDLNEFAHHQMMLALALEGRRNAALQQYKACEAILDEALGVNPSQELQDLYEQIIQEQITIQSKQVFSKHNLPKRKTSFIGREQELAELNQVLDCPSCRLLTITGPGGFGKTRLALELASRTWMEYRDGAYFVPLEKVSSGVYLVSEISKSIQFQLDDHISELSPLEQLLDYLVDRSMLLILDGYEHLLAEVDLLEQLLYQCPEIKLLITSRQKINLQQEYIYILPGLDLPENESNERVELTDSLRLFIERAEQIDHCFEMTASEYPPAVQICQLMEGMPLGIELAATWTPLLPCQEIANEIKKSLDFLETSMPDMPKKHRSLRAVFERSWTQMSVNQKNALSRLSVFQGGFNRQAAEQIAKVRLSDLSTLFNHSLLHKNPGGRMDMHRSIHQFTVEKLGQSPDEYDLMHERHARYFAKMLSDRERTLMGAGIVLARAEIRQDIENIRAAARWILSKWEVGGIKKFIDDFFVFLLTHGWHDGILEVDLLMERIKQLPRFQGVDLNPITLALQVQKAWMLSNLGRHEESEIICQVILEPLRQLGMKGELSACIQNLGLNAMYRGEVEDAIRQLSKAVELGKASGYVPWPSYNLWLGYSYYLLGQYEVGCRALMDCYETYQSWGSDWGAAFALSKVGLAADGLGQYEIAMQYHEEALKTFEETGDQAGSAYCLSRMSTGAYFLEDYDRAVDFGLKGYQEFEKIGHRWGIYASKCRCAFAYIGMGDLKQAEDLFYDVLENARKFEIVLLILYGLIGLGCVDILNGDISRGTRLIHFVCQNPKTPPLYIDLAKRWYQGYEIGCDDWEDEKDLEDLVDEVLETRRTIGFG